MSLHLLRNQTTSIRNAKINWKNFLFAIFILLHGIVSAQSLTSNYAFTTGLTGSLALDLNANAVDMTTGTTQVIGAGLDANVSGLASIGFEFYYLGSRFTQFSLNEDGIVQLGSTAIGTNTYTLTGGTLTLPRFAAFNADLRTGTTTGKVHYKVVGVAPSRCLVVEYSDMQLFFTTVGQSGAAKWQMRFYESTGIIEYVYGNMSVIDVSNGTSNRSPSIGFYSTSSTGSFASVIYSSHTVSTTSPYTANPAVTATGAITNLTSAADGARRFYRFTPTVPSAPTSLSFTNLGLSSYTLNWTNNGAGRIGTQIWNSTDNVNFNLVTTVTASATSYNASGLLIGQNYFWRLVAFSEGVLSAPLTGSQATNSCGSGISGVRTVGPGGDYATITAAVANIATVGISGSVILELNSSYTSSGETFPIVLGAIPCLSAGQTVTIRPAAGVTSRLITNSASTPTVSIDAGNFWIIDGRAGGAGASQLTISNTSTVSSVPTIRFQNEASNNIIQYTNVTGLSPSLSMGVISFLTTTGANGNDNNLIDNCNIDGGAGIISSPTATALNGIYSLGTTTTTATNNSGNTISNCNIYNFFGANNPSNGILIGSGSTEWTIHNNSIYQTTTRIPTGGNANNAITVNNSNGNNFQITNNKIGGDSPNASVTSQKWTISSAQANVFNAISITAGTTTASSIQGNVIANISVQSSGVTVFNGITISGGNINVGTVTGNTVGSSSVSATTQSASSIVVLQSTNNGGVVNGIASSSPGIVNISNNTIGGFHLNAASAPNTLGNTFYGIRITNGTNTIYGNTIGSSTNANSIYSLGSANSTTNANILAGMSITNGTNTIGGTLAGQQNTIQNIAYAASGGSGPSTGVTVYGIQATGGTNTITRTTIGNISSVSGNLGTGTLSSVIGLFQGSNTFNHTVSQNTIFGIRNTHPSAAVHVMGLYYNSSTGANLVERNLVYGIEAISASSQLFGIWAHGGTVTYRNNMVRLGTSGTTATTGMIINGINETTSGINNFYFNSVYIGGAPTTGSLATYAFQSSITNTRAIQNNIFFNARSNNGATGKHYAIRVSTTLTGLTCNFNVLLANGSGGLLGLWNSVDRADLASWRSATSLDANSISSDPVFIAPTAAIPDLHISTSIQTPVESAGIDIPSVTNDFDNDTRAANTPVDIGADAGAFISLPPMTYQSSTVTQLTGASCAGASNLAVARLEIVTTGSVLPLSLTSLTINANGTSNFSDISDYRIYYTGTSPVFSTANPVTAVGTGLTASNVIVPVSPAINLGTGSNYFWIVYNTSLNGSGSNLDAELVEVQLSAQSYTPVVTAPAGSYTLNPRPNVTLLPSSSVYCIPGGNPVTLTAGGALTYTYNPTTGLTPTNGTPVSAAPAGSTSYTVTGTDVNGCTNTASALVNVSPAIQNLTATATPSTICSGSSTSLSSTATFIQTVPNYIFGTSTGVALDPMIGSTIVVGSSIDDAPMALSGSTAGNAQPIGFSFPFEGVGYTHFSASPDGWLRLSNSTASTSAEFNNAISNSTRLPKIAPLWDDLTTGSNGSVRVLVTGSTPNRIFIVQWNVTIPSAISSPANSTYQAWLYETSGNIEFRYGTMGASASSSGGLTGAITTNFQSISFASNSVSTSTANNNNSVSPSSGRSYTFTPPTPFTYSWSPADSVISPNSQNTTSANLSVGQTFTVTATNSFGCTATANTSVAISSGTAISTNPVSITRCAGQSASFSVVASGISLTYQWRKDGIDIPVGTNASAGTATLTLTNVSTADAGSYDVVVSSSCGAPVISTAATLTVNLLPTISITPPSGLICLPGGAPISLVAAGANTYSWSPTSGLTPTTGASVSANPSVTTTYTVTGTDGNGCTGTATALITVSQAPILNATANPSTICENSNVQLRAVPTTTLVPAYIFSSFSGTYSEISGGTTLGTISNDDLVFNNSLTGSGSSSTGTGFPIGFNFSFNNQTFDKFAVSTNGYIVLGTGTFTIASAATGVLSTSSTAGYANLIAVWNQDLAGQTGSQLQYLTTGTAGNRVLTIQWKNYQRLSTTSNLNLQIKLFEADNHIELVYGSMSISTAHAGGVGLRGASNAAVNTRATTTNWLSTTAGTNSSTCTISPTVFPANGTTFVFSHSGNDTYLWSPTTFMTPGAELTSNPQLTSVASTTTYTVVATTSAGCTAASSTTVSVAGPVTITTEPAASISRCVGQSATFTVVASGLGLTYQWRKDGSDILVGGNASAGTATLTLPNVGAGDAGVYDVVVTSSCGSTVVSAGSVLTVNALPVVALTASSPATYCSPGGSAVTLTATGALTYAYSPTTGLAPSAGSVVAATPSANTTYTVTGTDVNGCTGTATAVVSVAAAVQNLTAVATPSLVCNGSTSLLTASGSIPFTANNYVFSTATEALLDPMTGATTLIGASVLHAPSATTAIGFNFPFEGIPYSHFSVSPDGWLVFGNSSLIATEEFSNVVTSTANIPKIYPFWDNIRTGTNGSVKSLVTGSAPNRILKVEWKVNIQNASSPIDATFQAWMYEIDGKIEFRYGTMGTSSTSVSGGLTGSVSTNFQSITYSTNSSSSATANNSNAVSPGAGRMYTFVPPATSLLSYSWSSPANLVSPLAAQTATTALSASETFTVTATSLSGCSATSPVTVTISDAVVITTQPSPLTVCAGASASFNVAASGVNLTYQWRKDGVDISVLSNPSAATAILNLTGVSAADAGVYTVLVNGGCGTPALSNGAAVLTINPLPVVTLVSSAPNYCTPGGTAVVLTASGALSYSYSPTTGLSPTTGAVVNATPSASTTYTVTGTDANGCSSTATRTVAVKQAPTGITATATPSSICPGGNSQLDVTVANIPGSQSILITEVTLSSSGTGSTVTYPSFVTGADLVEITNISASPVDVSGWTLADYPSSSSSATHTFNFPAGTIIPGNAVAVVNLGSGTNDPLNLYFNTGGTSDFYSSGALMGVVLKNGATVMDAVGLNSGYTFASGTGVTAANWSGFAPAAATFAGTIRVAAADGNTGADWVQSSAGTPQTIGTYNGGFNTPVSISSYAWSPSSFITGSTALRNPLATSVTAATSYSVAITTTEGCTVTGAVTVNVLPAVVLDAVAYPATICAGDSAQLGVNLISGAGTVEVVYSNTSSITINDVTGLGAPYPATITSVTGLASGATVKSVTITGLSHTWPADIDMVLVSPTGQAVTLISDCGGAATITNRNLTFRDGFPSLTTSTFSSGTYAPTNLTLDDFYPLPGPGDVTNNLPLSTFTGNLNGVWSLYIVDDSEDDAGSISGGFSITFENPVEAVYSWSPAGLMSNPAIANPKALVSGSTWFYLTAQNTNSGCLTTDSVFVNTVARPKPLITPSDTTVCFGTVLQLAVRDTGHYAGGYPSSTVIDWLGITNGLTQGDSVSSNNGSIYQVRVTLPNGCQALSSVRTINTRSVTTSHLINIPSCGNNNGSITTTAISGVGPYRFLWKSGAVVLKDTITNLASHTLSNLFPGNFTLEITDSFPFGCTSGVLTYNLPVTTTPAVSINSFSISCFGDQNAALSAIVTGGYGPLTYLWSNGSTTSSLSGLGAGTYTVVVTDSLGCVGTASRTLVAPPQITASVNVTNPLCPGSYTGSLSAIASGGTLPYIITSWYYEDPLNGFIIVSDSLHAINLPGGDYTLFIEDTNGCQASFNYSLIDPSQVVISSYSTSSGAIGDPVTITGSGFVNISSVKFNGTPAISYTVNSSTSITAVIPAGATTGPVTVTSGSCTPVVGPAFTVVGSSVVLNVKLFLQGFYMGGGLMTPVLFNNGLSMNPVTCDTVTVELRSATSPGDPPVVVRSLLVATDGTAQTTLPAFIPGNSYYLVVKHRNSLETWSKLPVTFTSVTTFDFTQ